MPKTPEIFYHITRTIHVDQILTEGLKPQIGSLSEYIGEHIPRIYLFDSIESVETALENWYGETIQELFDEDEPLTLLEINKKQVIKPCPTFADMTESYEWSTIHPIHPSAIKIKPITL